MGKPNIVYIMSDDHATNAVSVYNSRLAQVFRTPNIDRIANEGAVFKHCFCTNAICTPSRATILTGQYSHKTGVKTLRDALNTEINTFPKILQNNGYQTAIVGKWHLHSEPKGFDYYDVLADQGLYFNPYFIGQDFDWSTYEFQNVRQGKEHEGYVTDIITDKCITWLENRDKSRPFMLLCHFKAPHESFEYHPRYEHMFDGIEIPEPESLWEEKGHRSEGSRNFGSTVSEKCKHRNLVTVMSSHDYPTGQLDISGLDEEERTKAVYQKYLKDYLRTVKGIDDNVGRLLSYLENEGVLDDTFIVYTSDQGIFLGEHDYIDKRWIYEESLKMPLLMRYPSSIKPGTCIDEIVTNVDFAPTLLDFAGQKKTDEMQGLSFRSILEGNTPYDWPEAVYYRYWMHRARLHNHPAHYGIRTTDYKLIFFYGLPLDATGTSQEPTPAGWELYDLRKDPEEIKNVYNEPEYTEVIKSLKKRLAEMKKQLGDNDEKYPELIERLNSTI